MISAAAAAWSLAGWHIREDCEEESLKGTGENLAENTGRAWDMPDVLPLIFDRPSLSNSIFDQLPSTGDCHACNNTSDCLC